MSQPTARHPQFTALITERLSDAPANWLAGHVNVRWCKPDQPGFGQALAQADALVIHSYTPIDATLLDQGPKLKVIGRAGVGLEHVDLDACRQRGIEVVHTPGANTQAVVEYVLGLMLDAVRPRTTLEPASDDQAFHRLRKHEVGRQLGQLSLGILGFGRIGRRLGQVAHAIGMNLHVCDLIAEAQLRKAVDFPFDYVDQATLLGQSQIVSVHVDARPSNRHLINGAALAGLPGDAVLINASRGMVVDGQAVAAWAKANPAARAVLDVHDPEPPPTDSPLRSLSNVRLLPHLAARTHTAMENMNWVVTDVLAVLEGRVPKHPAT